MIIDSGTIKKYTLDVLSEARLLTINAYAVVAFAAYAQVCVEHGVVGTLTGAAREECYRAEQLHLKGYAWDFRSYIFSDPEKAAQRLADLLSIIDPLYRVVNIKPPKPAHFHVEYRIDGL